MNNFIVSFISLILCSYNFANGVNSAQVEFIGICESTPLIETSLAFEIGDNLGEVSIRVLEKYNIDYQGNARGINTAFDTPFGDESLVILSDIEMKAYGWCFSINGQVPEVFADQITLSDGDKISWYFAFAHYKDGEWIAQCSPSWKNPLKKWCSK
ncbi:MAG: DUF4430 domain-containing protein [Oligoflexia bacterium]|nr:DUF4430 domain-containing protein [Oligoflexia bacterium]